MADGNAAHPQTGERSMGSPVADQFWHYESDFYSGWADDGSPARLSKEITTYTPGRPHDGEAKARSTTIGVTHEKEAPW
jgi:hypothetical protein